MDESHEERRKNGGLTQDQIDAIKEAVLASVYEEIGRSIVKKVLWALGAISLTGIAWLVGSGHVSIK